VVFLLPGLGVTWTEREVGWTEVVRTSSYGLSNREPRLLTSNKSKTELISRR
jgi:hypothetical protein